MELVMLVMLVILVQIAWKGVLHNVKKVFVLETSPVSLAKKTGLEANVTALVIVKMINAMQTVFVKIVRLVGIVIYARPCVLNIVQMDVFATMVLAAIVFYRGMEIHVKCRVRKIVKMGVIEKMENVYLVSPTGLVKNVVVLAIVLVNFV